MVIVQFFQICYTIINQVWHFKVDTYMKPDYSFVQDVGKTLNKQFQFYA